MSDEKTYAPLTTEARVRLPNVRELEDIVYAFFIADDKSNVGTNCFVLANRVVHKFLSLEARTETETAYLLSVQGIVSRHAHALAQRKNEFLEQLADMREEKNHLLERMHSSSTQSAGLSALWKVMPYVILTLTGVVITQASGHIPQNATHLMSSIISMVIGLTFAVVGKLVSLWMRDLRRTLIESAFDARRHQAELANKISENEDRKYFYARLCEEWELYTGEKYPEGGSHAMIVEAEIEMKKRLERDRINHNISAFSFLRRVARIVRGRRKREDEERARTAGLSKYA